MMECNNESWFEIWLFFVITIPGTVLVVGSVLIMIKRFYEELRGR